MIKVTRMTYPGDQSIEITQLLHQVRSGDPTAAPRLLALIYPELRKMAARMMRSERTDHTLQPTALVHEAYLRLVGQDAQDWENRTHFFAATSQVMRHILVDHARRWRATKRGGAQKRVDLDHVLVATSANADFIIEVDRVLARLAEWDDRQSRVVEMRFFGGLSEEETAAVLGIGVRTVKRDWSMAKAWIHRELADYSP